MRSLRERKTRTSAPVPTPAPFAWGDLEQFTSWELPVAGGWNTLSTLGTGGVADVDHKGRISMRERPLSIDLWVGAGDRWWFPGREASVRQRRVEGLPVIETRMRVFDSDVVFTCWADEPGDDRGRVVVQLSTETDDPVVIGVVVRPFALRSRGLIESIRVVKNIIVADGQPVVILPTPPGDVIGGSTNIGDIPHRLGDQLVGDAGIESADGSATLAAMVPLSPGTDFVFEIVDGRDAATVAPAPLANVVSGWKSHLAASARVALPGWPDHVWASLTSGVLGSVAQDARGEMVAIGEAGDVDRIALQAVVLSSIGLDWASAATLDPLLEAVAQDRVPRESWVGIATACGRYGSVAGASDVLQRNADIVTTLVADLLTTGCGIEQIPELLRVVEMCGGPRALADAKRVERRRVELDRLRTLARLGAELGEEQWDELVESSPIGTPEDAAGVAHMLTLASRRPQERAAAPAAYDALVDLRRFAGDTWSWSHLDDADSAYARGTILMALRATVVAERADAVVLLPGFSERWLGRPIDVERLPLRAGRLSFSIRWHGARPALLWELEPNERGLPLRLEVPVLDPTFTTDELSGELLLEAPTWAVPVGPQGDE